MTGRERGRGPDGELRPMLSLAAPVIAAELGWMMLGTVDTLMLGRVDAGAVGAMGIGRVVYFTLAVFGMGLLLGLDTVVSRDHGAGRADECARWLVAGLWIALGLGLPVALALGAAPGLIELAGVDPAVARRAGDYLDAVRWSAVPLLLFGAFRRYLQATDRARPVMLGLVAANVVNLLANRWLIFGGLGVPPLAERGAAWATVIAFTFLALFTGAVSLHQLRERSVGRVPGPGVEPWRLVRLVRLGVPAALQVTLELSAFGAASVLAGRLAPTVLAAHHIGLTLVSTSYMLPLALAAAAVLVIVPRGLMRLFTPDPAVIAAGVPLLLVGALFQLFDGLQVVATGALRGAGDTRTPAIWSLIGHWAIGLPFGAWICFGAGFGAVGLWCGWLAGLGTVAIVLLRTWVARSRSGLGV